MSEFVVSCLWLLAVVAWMFLCFITGYRAAYRWRDLYRRAADGHRTALDGWKETTDRYEKLIDQLTEARGRGDRYLDAQNRDDADWWKDA